MHKPIGESPGPPSIQVDSEPSQSTVGLAHQRCTVAPQPTTQNTRVRGKALGVRLVWAHHITTQASTRWTLHTCTSYHPREGLPEALPFTWEEGSKQFMDHFNQLVRNSQAPVKVYFIT